MLMVSGEVYVLNDGGETDLDLGNYERYLDVSLGKDNNVTTGKVYQYVIEREVSWKGQWTVGCGGRSRRNIWELHVVFVQSLNRCSLVAAQGGLPRQDRPDRPAPHERRSGLDRAGIKAPSRRDG